jgi:dihydrodipicolinate synthase/N-acetylneuraminate lyase
VVETKYIMEQQKKFSGVMVPLLIPLTKAEELIEDEYRVHIRGLLTHDIRGFLSPSSTGEFVHLSQKTKEKIISVTADEVAGRALLISLAGECGTANSINNIRRAKDGGADAVMATPPYYYPLGQPELINHFIALADKGGLPLWLYHQPGDTKLSIEPESVVTLSQHPGIIGIKVSDNNLLYYGKLLGLLEEREDYSILFGEDPLLLPALAMGGDGAVSFLSNLMPGQIAGLVHAVKSGDVTEVRALQKRITQVYRLLIERRDGSPWHAAKSILRARGVFSGSVCTEPLKPLSDSAEAELLMRARESGLL